MTAAAAGRKSGRWKDPSKKRTKMISMALTQDELDMIDAKATSIGLSRAEFVVRAARKYEP